MTAPAVALLALLASAGVLQESPGGERLETEGCAVCHGKESVSLAGSVHGSIGFSCVSCHGGDAGALEAEAAHAGDFRALTDPIASVQSCGECHSDVQRMRVSGLRTDQLALYRTSRHGLLLFQDGNPDVATCSDCHQSHAIRPVSDPASTVHPRNQPETCGACHDDAGLMEPYGLGSDMVELYRRSVHGIAAAEGRISSPVCSDCHGSHGALPPRVGEVEQVCGHCHAVVQENFEESPHFLQDTGVQCVTCHGDHLVLPPVREALTGAGPGACSTCHTGTDDPALQVAAGLHADLTSFEARIEETAADARRAASRGLYLDQELGFLDDAWSVLARARSLTHANSRERLDELLNRGLGMIGQTEDSLDKLGRVGRDRAIFTTLFFALTLALGIMLLMYAREIRGGVSRRATDRPRGSGNGT